MLTCVFNNLKQFTMIVLICEEATSKLYASQVTVTGAGGEITTSLGPSGALEDLGLTDELLCSLAGARYEDLHTVSQLLMLISQNSARKDLKEGELFLPVQFQKG